MDRGQGGSQRQTGVEEQHHGLCATVHEEDRWGKLLIIYLISVVSLMNSVQVTEVQQLPDTYVQPQSVVNLW